MTLSGKMLSGREFREGHVCIQEEAEGIMGRKKHPAEARGNGMCGRGVGEHE